MKRLFTGVLAAMLMALATTAQSETRERTATADANGTDAIGTGAKGVETAATETLPGLETFMDATITTQMMALDIPAVSLAVVKDGHTLLLKGYGMADQQTQSPVTSDTLFRPGSISKLFTWVAVMQQVEAGNLDLNADVNSYLETFQIPDTYAEPITLAHILAHTSGFEEGALGYLIASDPDAIMPLRDALAKYMPRRINKPGAYSSYSNYATALAGLIVSNVSGLSFADYIKQHIFTPLGMTHSSFEEPLPDDLAPYMAGGYKREAGAYKQKPFELIANFGPAGSLSASASDMGRFMRAVLGGGVLDGNRILKAETVDKMLSRLFATDGRLASMAHGFYENTINGHHLVGHGGDTTLFHSNLMLDRAENLGIYVSYMGAKGGKARGELIQLFYDHYYPLPIEQIAAPDDFNGRAARYAGAYKFWRHNQSTLEKVASIMPSISVAPSPDNTLIVTIGGEPRQFVEIGDNLFRQIDGRTVIAFGEDGAGNVQDLYIDGVPFMSASRQPAAESGLFSMILPLLSFVFFGTVWAGWVYRRKEFKTMQPGERTAIRLSLATSGLNLLFIIALGIILTVYQDTIVFDIPTALKVALWLPDIASITALIMLWFAVQAWRQGYWRIGRRIHYTLVTLSGLFMAWFYYYWNFLGVQLA